jgi:hypothetical protein
MLNGLYADALRQEGFQLIGQLDYRLHLTVWWNPDKRLGVIVFSIGQSTLIRGDKSYYLKSVSPEGETWTRDIQMLHTYLEDHFPSVRISCAHLRDVPPGLAQMEVQRRMAVEAPAQPMPTLEDIAELQKQLRVRQRDVRGTENLLSLSSTTDLLTGYMREQGRSQRHEIGQLEAQLERQKQRLGLFQHLQREYERKGSAAAYSFTINSNLQVADNRGQFHDALRAVVKELTDQHRYQVMQKLQGGRLNIQVAEAEEPLMVWIEQWLGGTLSPRQMSRLGAEFDLLRKAATDHLLVTPDEPILVDGHVRHAEKHLGARFVSTVLQRLDKTDTSGRNDKLSPESITPDAMPLSLGLRVDDREITTSPVIIPLSQMGHTYVSGTTGGGKSFLARVLIEEAVQHQQLNILVLDPRNQSAGLLVAEDRPAILQNYNDFGMKPGGARGFKFSYFAPALAYAPPMPQELSSLAMGRSIVSFKGLDDQKRCELAGRILEAVFDACSSQEAESPRLLILIDEAHLFTRKRLDKSAKESAAQAERAIDKLAREGRKFGVLVVLISQTIKDFGYELASIRQMTSTKIFLRNSDREIEYAADIIGDGRLLVQLPTGTTLIHNANWGVLRVRVRPPYSKVFELGEAEMRRLVGHSKEVERTISVEARKLFEVIKEHGSPPHEPLNMSRVANLAGISSKRKLLELIEELVQANAIRTSKLPGRGRPHVIEVICNSSCQSSIAPDKFLDP